MYIYIYVYIYICICICTYSYALIHSQMQRTPSSRADFRYNNQFSIINLSSTILYHMMKIWLVGYGYGCMHIYIYMIGHTVLLEYIFI